MEELIKYEIVKLCKRKIFLMVSIYKIANIMLVGDKICMRIVSDRRPDVGEIREVRPNLEDVYLYFAE